MKAERPRMTQTVVFSFWIAAFVRAMSPCSGKTFFS